MRQIFSEQSPYKKKARVAAVLWTLLIFVGCFTPGKDLPKVDAPLIDKWVHIVLFGGFGFLWMCAFPTRTYKWMATMLGVATALGIAIELLQAALPFLGRSCEWQDALADAIGAFLGICLFALLASFLNKPAK